LKKQLKCSVILSLVGLLLLSTALSAFPQQKKSPGQYTSIAAYERATGRKINKFNEAPVLTEFVKQGKLPVVQKRLPSDPVVVEPVEEIGEYGGTAQTFSRNPSHYYDGLLLIGYEPLLRIARDGSTVIPNLAKAWTLSPDGKTLTIYLRRGLKWSDGYPFTADDILFWYEDILLNDELTPVKPADWSPGGELMKVKKINDYTVQFNFKASYGIIPLRLAFARSLPLCIYPKHYLKQFHPRYTSKEKLEELAKKEGFDAWYKLFAVKSAPTSGWGPSDNPDMPVLTAFKCIKKSTNGWILERNPYYWKIDTAGNQLPYIDRIVITLLQDTETMNMKAISGEATIAGNDLSTQNYPLYKENTRTGNYRVLTWKSVHGSSVHYMVNQTYQEDPVLRNLFRDKRFRIALSLAINRDEINQMVFLGTGEPRQLTVVPQSKYYEEKFAKAYAEYNPQKADQILDELGLKRGSDGYRIRPDGKRLEILIEYTQTETPKREVTELVQHYWESIGIKTAVKEIENSLRSTRYQGNLVQIGVWHADACSDILFPVDRRWFVPGYTHDTTWAPLWAQWVDSNGKAGEEPPQEIKRLRNLWDQMQATTSEKTRIRLGKEILKVQAENLWCIGTVGLPMQPVIVKNNLKNIPNNGLWGYDLLFTYTCNPEQFFLKK